jgi:hypothetical protein
LAAAAEGARLGGIVRLAEESAEREHGPLASEIECASAQVSLALVDPELVPEVVQDVGAAERHRGDEL